MAGWFYWILVLAGTALLMMQNWRANIWWVAFYSAAIYSMPIAMGRDLFGMALTFEATSIMLTVMIVLLVVASLKQPVYGTQSKEVPIAKYFVLIAVLVSLASFCALIAVHGLSIFFTHKTESGIGGYFYVLWRLSASYALLACLMARRYRLAMFAALPLVASLFAGDRTAFGLTLIAALWMGLQSGRLAGMRLGLIVGGAVLLGVFLFFGKTFQAQWATGTFTSLPDLVRTVANEGTEAVTKTEPFGTMGVLNALTKLNSSPADSLLLSVAAQFLIVPSFLGFDSGSFNDFFQPLLFSDYRERSLAYSYWGEAFVRGGWFGVASFLLVFIGVLLLFERATLKSSFPVRAFAYVGGSYWAFYIHRNSMVSIFAYERQVLLFVLVLTLGAYFFRAVNRRINR